MFGRADDATSPVSVDQGRGSGARPDDDPSGDPGSGDHSGSARRYASTSAKVAEPGLDMASAWGGAMSGN